MTNNSVTPTCFQCGSPLIFVSQEIVKPEGTRYPQTNTVYRCSNEDCQKKKDKEKAERLKLRLNKEATEQARIEKMQEKRKLDKEAEMAAD